MRCDACGREARTDDSIGTTCGDFIPKAYVPLTAEQQREQIVAFRLGEPLPASHPASIVRERCLGVIQ